MRQGVVKDETPKRCVHFYACICAFASDEKLAEEFAYYINLDQFSCTCKYADSASYIKLIMSSRYKTGMMK